MEFSKLCKANSSDSKRDERGQKRNISISLCRLTAIKGFKVLYTTKMISDQYSLPVTVRRVQQVQADASF